MHQMASAQNHILPLNENKSASSSHFWVACIARRGGHWFIKEGWQKTNFHTGLLRVVFGGNLRCKFLMKAKLLILAQSAASAVHFLQAQKQATIAWLQEIKGENKYGGL